MAIRSNVAVLLVALQLVMFVCGAHASCTAVNRSDKALQISVSPIVLTLNATAGAGQQLVNVAANATASFAINATSAILVFVNQASKRVSPPRPVADGSTLLISPSSTVTGAVDVSLAITVGTLITPFLKLVQGL